MSFTRLLFQGPPPTFHTANDGSWAEPGNEAILTQARIHCVFPTLTLIAAMEYGMERWNGKWNGMVNVHTYV